MVLVKANFLPLFASLALFLGGCAMMAENRRLLAEDTTELTGARELYRQKLPVAKPLLIIGHHVEHSDKTEEVSAFVQFQNTSAKTIKYVYITVTALNRVGDRVDSTPRHPNSARLQSIGPLAPGEVTPFNQRWKDIWRTAAVSFMRIDSLEVEFMDGTTERVEGEALKAVQLWPSNNDFTANFQQGRTISLENGKIVIWNSGSSR